MSNITAGGYVSPLQNKRESKSKHTLQNGRMEVLWINRTLEEVFERLLEQKDCFVFQPTGSVKSCLAIFKKNSVNENNSAVTFLISPKTSLIENQKILLKRHGINCNLSWIGNRGRGNTVFYWHFIINRMIIG